MIVTSYSLSTPDPNYFPFPTISLAVEEVPGEQFGVYFRIELIGSKKVITKMQKGTVRSSDAKWLAAGPEWNWLIEAAADIAKRNNLVTLENWKDAPGRSTGLTNCSGGAI